MTLISCAEVAEQEKVRKSFLAAPFHLSTTISTISSNTLIVPSFLFQRTLNMKLYHGSTLNFLGTNFK